MSTFENEEGVLSSETVQDIEEPSHIPSMRKRIKVVQEEVIMNEY